MSTLKRRISVLISAIFLFCVFLLGCGNTKYDTTTLEFKNDGSFILHIVDSFDESRYSLQEFTALNEAEVNVYNSYGKGKVTIENTSLENGVISVDMRYSDDDAYFDLNHVVLFYGNIKSAKNAGYNLVGKVNGVGGEGALDQVTFKNMENQKVVVVSEQIEVVLPGKILYVGEGVTLTKSNAAKIEGEGLHYIICE